MSGAVRDRFRRLLVVPGLRLADYVVHSAALALAFGALGFGAWYDVFGQAWNSVYNIGSDIVGWVKEAIDQAKDWIYHHMILPVWSVISTVTSQAWDWVQNLWDQIRPLLDGLTAGIADVFRRAVQWGTEAIMYWYHQAVDFAGALVAPIRDLLDRAWGTVRTLGDTIYHTMIEPVWHGITDAITAFYNSVIAPVLGQLHAFLGDIWRYISPFVQPVIDDLAYWKDQIVGAVTMARKLWDALWPIVTNPLGWFEHKLSDVLTKTPQWITDTVLHTLEGNADKVENMVVRWLG